MPYLCHTLRLGSGIQSGEPLASNLIADAASKENMAMTSRLLAIAFALALLTPAVSLAGNKDEAHPDFTGLWRLDRAASDVPPPGGRGPHGGGPAGGIGMHGHGPDTHRGAEGGGGGGPRPGGPRRLPELIHITLDASGMSLEDSTGAVLQEVTMDGKPSETDPLGMPVGKGEWKKGELEVKREGPRGKVTEWFALQDQGATLMVKTHMSREGGSVDFTRVYRRQTP
jgi:hypothetical protein